MAYRGNLEPIISRIYHSISGSSYEQFPISLSMGVARTEVVGTDYDALFHAADQALYKVKRSGRGRFRFYDESMRETLSAISPIDGGKKEKTKTENDEGGNRS